MSALAHKLPPAAPTVLQLAGKAIAAERMAQRASLTGREYAAEETAAMNASARFWAALERDTGLTREMLGEMM